MLILFYHFRKRVQQIEKRRNILEDDADNTNMVCFFIYKDKEILSEFSILFISILMHFLNLPIICNLFTKFLSIIKCQNMIFINY